VIIYTMTMDKVRSIATLKFVGAPIAPSSASSFSSRWRGDYGYFAGLALVFIFRRIFHGARVRSESIAAVLLSPS